MEYEVIEPGHVLLPHFRLMNDQGQVAFVTVDIDPAWRRRARPRGRFISSVWIPGNLLSEGMIYVQCNLITLDPIMLQFKVNDAISFLVVDNLEGDTARGDYIKDMDGVVRPMLHWETNFTKY